VRELKVMVHAHGGRKLQLDGKLQKKVDFGMKILGWMVYGWFGVYRGHCCIVFFERGMCGRVAYRHW
jgi:hypothetical protein